MCNIPLTINRMYIYIYIYIYNILNFETGLYIFKFLNIDLPVNMQRLHNLHTFLPFLIEAILKIEKKILILCFFIPTTLLYYNRFFTSSGFIFKTIKNNYHQSRLDTEKAPFSPDVYYILIGLENSIPPQKLLKKTVITWHSTYPLYMKTLKIFPPPSHFS